MPPRDAIVCCSVTLELELRFAGENVTVPPTATDGDAEDADADAASANDTALSTSGLLQREVSPGLAQELVDTPLVVALVAVNGDARDDVATGNVDLAALAVGEVSIEAAVQLALVEDVVEGVALPEDGCEIGVKVTVPGTAAKLYDDADVSDANVVTLAGIVAAPLPAECASGFTFAIALELPGGDAAPAVRAEGRATPAIEEEGDATALSATWGAPTRIALSPAAGAALREAALSAATTRAELARYPEPADSGSDPLFTKYLAAAALPLEELGAPGATEVSVEAHLSLRAPPSSPDDEAAAPPAMLAAAEEAGDPVAACANDAPLEEGVTSGPWEAAGGKLSLTLSVLRPLVDAWAEPPVPTIALETLIPARPAAPKLTPPVAAEGFIAEVRATARMLASEYRSLHSKELLSGSDVGVTGAPLPPGLASERHRHAVFELNRTGQFAALKARLRQAAVRVARERFEAKGVDAPSPEEIELMQHSLHVELVELMRKAMADEAKPKQTDPAEPSDIELAALADERERAGDTAGADDMHAKRVGGEEGPHSGGAWAAYGTFYMRQGRAGRGEECLKEAAARLQGEDDDAAHTVLLALAAVALETGRAPDAEALGHAAKAATPNKASAWLLLALIYEQMAMDKAALDCAWEGTRLEKATGGTRGSAWATLNAEVAALRLPTLAAAAAAKAALPGAAAAEGVCALARARAAAASGSPEGAAAARELALEAIADGGPDVVGPAQALVGEQASVAGDYQAAASAFGAAAAAAGDGTRESAVLLWRKGSALLKAQQAGAAVKPLLESAASMPCATHWLTAGEAYVALGDAERAEQCLSEANTLDPLNARVWGALAALCFQGGHADEGARALAEARYTGLDRLDAKLLEELEGLA